MKGYFRKRGDKWSFTVDIGRDPATGRRKQKTKSGYKTKKEAQAACAEFITRVEKEGYVDTKKITLFQFMNEYIETEVIPKLSVSTAYNYKRTLKLVSQTIGSVELNNLNAMHMQQFNKHLRSHYNTNGSINLYITCLKKVLRVAYEWRMIPYDVGIALKRSKTERKIDKFWSYFECMEFLEKVKDDQYYYVYLLTIFTGMRRGEVLGVSEENCDFVNNIIHVKQQVKLDDNGQPILADKLKSDSSYRSIEVPSDIMNRLKNYIHENKKIYLQLGMKRKHNLLFLNQDGNLITPNYLSRRYKQLCDKYGFRNITFHGLRHSHATILAESKEHVQAIADRLGHSSTSITDEMYIHLTKKMKHSLIDTLETLYSKGKTAT